MPDEPVETTQANSEPGAGEKPGQEGAFNFDEWLAAQPADVRAGFDAHINGLKSALEKERRANKRREDEAEAARRKAQEAELSELQKAQKRLAELEQANQALQAAQRISQAREALRQAAGKARLEFVSPAAEADALDIALKLSTFDDDGQIGNADEVWKTIVKERDYLIKRADRPAGDTNAGARGGSSKPVRTDDEKRELAAIYGVRPEYIP